MAGAMDNPIWHGGPEWYSNEPMRARVAKGMYGKGAMGTGNGTMGATGRAMQVVVAGMAGRVP